MPCAIKHRHICCSSCPFEGYHSLCVFWGNPRRSILFVIADASHIRPYTCVSCVHMHSLISLLASLQVTKYSRLLGGTALCILSTRRHTLFGVWQRKTASARGAWRTTNVKALPCIGILLSGTGFLRKHGRCWRSMRKRTSVNSRRHMIHGRGLIWRHLLENSTIRGRTSVSNIEHGCCCVLRRTLMLWNPLPVYVTFLHRFEVAKRLTQWIYLCSQCAV